MTLKPSEFPYGKVPHATLAETNVTCIDDADTEACQVVGDGIHAGVTVLVIATADITTGANTSDLIVTIYETALGGDTVGETMGLSVTAGAEDNFCIMRLQQAYQTNPVYVLGITCTAATANSTVNNSCIAVIPIGA